MANIISSQDIMYQLGNQVKSGKLVTELHSDGNNTVKKRKIKMSDKVSMDVDIFEKSGGIILLQC